MDPPLASVRSEWDAATATGYRDVALAPQFCFRSAETEPHARIVVQRLPITDQGTGFSFAVACSRGLRVTDGEGCMRASPEDPDARCDEVKIVAPFGREFSRTKAEAVLKLDAGIVYTIVVPTFDTTGRGAFQVDVSHATTGVPLRLAGRLTPIGPKTFEQQRREDASAVAAASASRERERKRRTLELMRAHANNTPAGSRSRADFVDYIDAVNEVERRRAAVRARGPGEGYADGWSGASGAIGAWNTRQPAVWRRLHECAPHPAIVVDGFRAAALQQGELDNCTVISSLVHLVRLLGECPWTLDRILVTTEYNPEDVYCVRLWEGTVRAPRGGGVRQETPWRVERTNGYVWYFLDARIPTRPDCHWKPTSDVCWSGGPTVAEGKFAVPLGVSSATRHEFWSCLLEKALACRQGSYAAIQGGVFGDSDEFGCMPLLRFLPQALPCLVVDVSRGAKLDEVRSATLGRTGPLPRLQPAPMPAAGVQNRRQWPLSQVELDALAGAQRDALMCCAERGWVIVMGARKFEAGEVRFPKDADQHGIVRDHSYTAWVEGGRFKARNPHGRGDPKAGGDGDGVFWLEHPVDVWQSFSKATVTPLAPLANDGGSWHMARAPGTFHEAVARRGHEHLLDATQFFVSPRPGGGNGWVLMSVMPDDAWVAAHAVGIYPSIYSGADLRPLTEADFCFSRVPPIPARATRLTGVEGRGMAHRWVWLDTAAGTIHISVCAPGVEVEGQAALRGSGYTFTVWSELDFDLRIAQPGKPVGEPVPKQSDPVAADIAVLEDDVLPAVLLPSITPAPPVLRPPVRLPLLRAVVQAALYTRSHVELRTRTLGRESTRHDIVSVDNPMRSGQQREVRAEEHGGAPPPPGVTPQPLVLRRWQWCAWRL